MTEPDAPQPLEYARRHRGVRTDWVWLVLALLAFAAATFVALLPDLHAASPFWFVWAIVAPIATYVSLRVLPPRRAPATAPMLWLLLALLWILGVLAVYSHFTSIDPHAITNTHTRCLANLRTLDSHLAAYASTHGGHYPDRLEDLLSDNSFFEPLDPQTLVAPFSLDTPATGPTTQAVLAQLAGGRHRTYIYLGKGLTTACPSGTVLIYEPLSTHRPTLDGIHVLQAGLPPTFLPTRKALQLIPQLQSPNLPKS